MREVFPRQDELESVGIRLSEIVKLGNMFGKVVLAVDKYKQTTRG